MKKLFLRLGLIASLSFALFSCNEASDSHQNLIPKDADIVLAMHPHQIAEKAELSDSKNAELINRVVESIANDELAEQLKELIKNPEKSGLDVEAPVYGFMNFSEEKQEPEFLALALKLKSADDFKKVFFNLNATENKELEEGEISGFKTLKIKGVDEFVIATKENQGLIFGGNPKHSLANLKAILEQKEDNSFASTELFAKMNETQEDFEAAINYGKLAKSIQNAPMYRNNALYTEMLEEVEGTFPLNEIYYLFALNSEKGALKFTTDIYSENDKVDEILEQSSKMIPEADGTFLNKLPKNALYVVNFALDGSEIWEFAQKYYPKAIAKAEEEAKKDKDLGEIGVTIEDIVKSFDGDAAFSLAGTMAGFQQEKADMRAFVELGNTETAVKLLNKFLEEFGTSDKLEKITENQYVFMGDMPVRFGLKDDVFFVGTKEVENVDGLFEDLDPNIKASNFGSKLEDKRVAMVVNISGIVELAKPFLGFVIPSVEAINSLEELDYLSMTNTDKLSQTETILKLKNDKNPYALLLKIARELK